MKSVNSGRKMWGTVECYMLMEKSFKKNCRKNYIKILETFFFLSRRTEKFQEEI